MRPHPWVIAWGVWLVLMAAAGLTELGLPKRPAPEDATGEVRKRTERPDSSGPHRSARPAGATNAPAFRISGIMGGANGNIAIINGRPVSRGQTVNGARVLSVGRREVEMEKDGRRFTVRMESASGSSGAPPGR